MGFVWYPNWTESQCTLESDPWFTNHGYKETWLYKPWFVGHSLPLRMIPCLQTMVTNQTGLQSMIYWGPHLHWILALGESIPAFLVTLAIFWIGLPILFLNQHRNGCPYGRVWSSLSGMTVINFWGKVDGRGFICDTTKYFRLWIQLWIQTHSDGKCCIKTDIRVILPALPQTFF